MSTPNDPTTPPDMERRLLLAFALTMLVIAGWPVLSHRMGWAPQPTQPATEQVQQHGQITPQNTNQAINYGQITPLQPIKSHVDWEYKTLSTILGFSHASASVAQLTIRPPTYHTQHGELDLTTGNEGPGLGAVAWETPGAPWNGWTLVERPADASPGVRYRGTPAPGLIAESRYDLRQAPQNALTLTLSVTNATGAPQTIQPRLLAGRPLQDPLDHGRYRLLRASVAGKAHAVTLGREAMGRRLEGSVDWVTAQTKYYTAIMAPTTTAVALVITRGPLGDPQAWVEWPAATIAPGATQQWEVRGYVGPLDYRFLDALQLDQAASLGAFTTITRLLQAAMNFLVRLFHSYGAAIVALTVFLSLLFSPLTWVSFRTMKQMELLQPELKVLQDRYSKDPKRLNEEVMKAYRTHKVNPLAGCLPLLLQMPIFISLYQVLSRSPDLRGARFLLIKDLAAPDALIPLPAALPLLGSAINVLPLAMAGAMFLQQRLSSKGKVMTEEQRAQQQVFVFMPVLFGVMFYSLPSGLVLYWLLNTSFSLLQQQVVFRRMV